MKPVLLLAFMMSLCSLDAAAGPAGGTLEKLKQSGVIRLGYLESAAPFSHAGDDGPVGYSIDLCKQVVADLQAQLGMPDLRAEWVPVAKQDRLDALTQDRIDLECGTTTWTLSRQEAVDFSLMTFVDGGSLLIRAGQAPTRIAEFADRKVAVVSGTTTEAALERVLDRRAIGAQLIKVQDEREGMRLLAAGKTDAFASDRLVLMGLALEAQGSATYRLIDEDFSLEPYALAMRRDDADFRLAVNRSLAGVFRSGAIVRIYDLWFGALGRPGVLLSSLYILQGIPE